MKTPWVKTIRRASGLIEHVCKCGVGHPAIGSIHWMKLSTGQDYGTHECCGCCQKPKWKLVDAQEGCRIANELFFKKVAECRALAAIYLEQKIHLSMEKPK